MAAIRISIVCPFFNEEAIIEAAARRMLTNLRAQFGESNWELILVNDGSRDRSLEYLVPLLQMEKSRIKLLSFPRNQGRGRALKAGIDAAAGDLIVTTEVDCSWGDQIVQQLVGVLDAAPEADFVVASPHMSGGGLVNVPQRRVLLTKIGNLLIRAFSLPMSR